MRIIITGSISGATIDLKRRKVKKEGRKKGIKMRMKLGRKKGVGSEL